MTSTSTQLSVEDRVVASVKALKAAQGASVSLLCAALGISRATWFKRLHDGQFTIGEIAALAQLFSVPVQAIVDGIGLKSQLQSITRVLRALPPHNKNRGGGGAYSRANRLMLVSMAWRPAIEAISNLVA